ncbi:hypothetical protein V5799_000086 [Amblyomma americanum]|uniref:Peptidase S1 domain-containing protein n=1 Tax=Amblyomma americanum TaxID=6943 RepID=A0AAQ4D423_AMBAM
MEQQLSGLNELGSAVPADTADSHAVDNTAALNRPGRSETRRSIIKFSEEPKDLPSSTKKVGPSQRLLYFTSLRVMPDRVCMQKFGVHGFNKTLQFCAYGDATDACEAGGVTFFVHIPHATPNVPPYCLLCPHSIHSKTRPNNDHGFQGDSGGPAIARADNKRFLQVGIVSYGTGCADKDIPGVYTRLDAFVPWILENVLYGTWLILYPTGELK